MKLKANSRILFVSVLLLALAMGGCNLIGKKTIITGLPNHPDPTGGLTDTFWAASGHTFLVIPTATVIIVDQKGLPVAQAGILVTAKYGNGNVVTSETNSSGTAPIQILGLSYPLTISATSVGHEFATVSLQTASQLTSKISITELK